MFNGERKSSEMKTGLSDPVEWYCYSKCHPPCGGHYLWARNNWNVLGGDGEWIHSYVVSIGYWDGEWDDSCNGSEDPDQWAFVPYPDKAMEPGCDPAILRNRQDRGESPEMDKFEHKLDIVYPPLFENRESPILYRRFD